MNKAHIIFIDDHSDEVRTLAKEVQHLGATSSVFHPREIESADELNNADLVVVDFVLDEGWPERDQAHLSLQVKDGLALASVLRRHAAVVDEEPPTAFVVLTGDLEKLCQPLPTKIYHPHILSRLNNLEWVFEKGEKQLPEKIFSLAKAVAKLPTSWNSKEPRESLLEFLGCDPNKKESPRLDDFERCIPPHHYVAQWSSGLAVCRWLAHRILPYPTFLWGDAYLAARCAVTPQSLRAAIREGNALGECVYRGALAELMGRRWWRADIEKLLWEITEQRSFQIDYVRDALAELLGTNLEPAETSEPVIALDERFIAIEDRLFDRQDVRKVLLDDWPLYAEPAFVPKESLTPEEEYLYEEEFC